MKILTNKEMEFLLDYYRQILNLTKSTDIQIRARFYMRKIIVLQSCPWWNEENI